MAKGIYSDRTTALEADSRRQENWRAASQDYRTRHSQDIGFAHFGPIGRGPEDPDRRRKACDSLRTFCETYFPDLFYLGWSEYHLNAIEKIESAILQGKLFALAMPRGSGKTSLCRIAILWATFNGHAAYPLLITATASSASRRLQSLKKIVRTNDRLLADYPEICYAVRFLKNESTRAKGQKFFGAPTDIEWLRDKFVLPMFSFDSWPEEEPEGLHEPWISKSKVLSNWKGIKTGFGSIIDVTSMEGEIRGRSFSRADGVELRPDVAIVDDPQTLASAKSVSMIDTRESTLAGDIRYLGGPGKPTGVVVPCTVIMTNDLADRLLDLERHPEYRGSRSAMVKAFPPDWEDCAAPEGEDDTESVKLWRQYRKLQISDLQNDTETATEFYRKHQDKMDEGFEVSWPERYNPGEISAVQHAMNLYFSDQSSFFAEAQNDPASAATDRQSRRITVDDIAERVEPLKRRELPVWTEKLVAFIDISEAVLWYVVLAVRPSDFRSCIVDFAAYPDQHSTYFTLGTVRKTISKQFGGSFEVALGDALGGLTKILSEYNWTTEDDRELSIDAIGIDSGWGAYSQTVYQFCRRSPLRSILHATKGIGVTATSRPLVDPAAKRKKGEIESTANQYKVSRTKVRTPLLLYDTNFWKSKAYGLLKVKPQEESSLTLYTPKAPRLTRMLAEQLTSEIPVTVEAKGRRVEQWELIPNRDNHYFDCLVGCLVLAARLGSVLPFSSGPDNNLKDTKAHGSKPSGKRSRRRRRSEVTF
jgi:hypothetical protein